MSLVLMCSWPLPRAALLFAKQLFMLEQRQRSGWLGLRPNAAAMAVALRASQHELAFLMGHPLWLPFSLAPLLQALRYSPPLLLDVLLAALLEKHLLITSHDVASLLPVSAALCHLLSPLSFSGVFIPFLPAALHPEPETLVNHTPTPFIIGVEAQTLPLLQPLSEHVMVLDLDAATLSGPGAAELRELARETPCLQRLERRLVGCCETEGTPELDERQVQAALLSFMREILSVAPQQALHTAAADGSSIDGLRAHSFAVADALSQDTLRTTADFPNAEAIAKRVLMCRADALGRICSEPPCTPTASFLKAAYKCRTLREFLLTPQGGGQGAFGDAAWLASQLDARQSIGEHAMALDAVHALVEARLSDACVQLREARLLSPRTANFQQRFEVGVNETLLGAFPCALQYMAGLRHGVLYVSNPHPHPNPDPNP